MVKATSELVLTSCICSDVLLSIAGQFKELPLIDVYELVALHEIAKPRLLAVDNPFRDVPSAEGSLEICPRDFCPSR